MYLNRLNLTIDEALYEQAELILEAYDEKELLSILSSDEFTSNEDFKSKFNL